METLQERCARILTAEGYTATIDTGYGGFVNVLDPVRVSNGSGWRIEYKPVRVHHLDMWKFIADRS